MWLLLQTSGGQFTLWPHFSDGFEKGWFFFLFFVVVIRMSVTTLRLCMLEVKLEVTWHIFQVLYSELMFSKSSFSVRMPCVLNSREVFALATSERFRSPKFLLILILTILDCLEVQTQCMRSPARVKQPQWNFFFTPSLSRDRQGVYWNYLSNQLYSFVSKVPSSLQLESSKKCRVNEWRNVWIKKQSMFTLPKVRVTEWLLNNLTWTNSQAQGCCVCIRQSPPDALGGHHIGRVTVTHWWGDGEGMVRGLIDSVCSTEGASEGLHEEQGGSWGQSKEWEGAIKDRCLQAFLSTWRVNGWEWEQALNVGEMPVNKSVCWILHSDLSDPSPPSNLWKPDLSCTISVFLFCLFTPPISV